MPTPVWKGSTSLIVQKNSGTLTVGDRSTGRDVYRGPGAACYAGILARGTFGSGGRAGWVVTSSVSQRVESQGGDIWELTINWEAGGSSATMPLPCDEFAARPQEDYLSIYRASMFSGILPTTVALVEAAAQGGNQQARIDATTNVNDIPDSTQKTLGLKLLTKLLKGEEKFYISTWRYTWVSYSYSLPSISMGGILSAPGGPLASALSGFGNQLRLADGLRSAGVNGSCYRITRTWLIGSPTMGAWDTDIYS